MISQPLTQSRVLGTREDLLVKQQRRHKEVQVKHRGGELTAELSFSAGNPHVRRNMNVLIHVRGDDAQETTTTDISAGPS